MRRSPVLDHLLKWGYSRIYFLVPTEESDLGEGVFSSDYIEVCDWMFYARKPTPRELSLLDHVFIEEALAPKKIVDNERAQGLSPCCKDVESLLMSNLHAQSFLSNPLIIGLWPFAISRYFLRCPETNGTSEFICGAAG